MRPDVAPAFDRLGGLRLANCWKSDDFSLKYRYTSSDTGGLLPTAIASETTRLGELGLTDDDLARATGAARSTARAWLSERNAPTGERAERLIELAALVERLERLIERDYIPIWLRKPVPALNDDKPLDVIGSGEYRKVARLISELEGTTAS